MIRTATATTLSPRPPHLLYVAWGFPPCRGSGVYRALATANQFARSGWDVTVLTVERQTFTSYTGVDESLEALIDPSISVVRTPFSWPYLESTHSWFRRMSPRAWHRMRRRLDELAFPERVYGPWRHVVEDAALNIHHNKPVDLVLATANPATAWTAAHVLHVERGVPYVLDQRDAWTLDVFTGAQLQDEVSAAARWERRLFRDAQQVWFVNDSIAEWHKKRYPESAGKLISVPNGWDQDSDPLVLTSGAHDGHLTFGYLGTITRKVPIRSMVEGWIRAGWHNENLRQSRLDVRGHLGFYSAEDAVLSRVMSVARAAGVTWGGPMPKSQIAAFYGQCDALVLALGAGSFVTSGKVYEYMATGLPIISVHPPQNAAGDVLKEYPWWFPISSLDVDEVAHAFLEVAKIAPLTNEQRQQGRAVGMKYRRDVIMAPHIQELRTIALTRSPNSR